MDSADPLQEKVTAFVIRPAPSGSQLLIFRHPTAGFQLPAGTVEAGERPEEAVVREVAEETGLSAVVKRCLGFEDTLLGDGQAVLRPSSVELRTQPRPDAPLLPEGLQRGALMAGERRNGYVWVRREEYDLNRHPPVLLWMREGWLAQDQIAHGMRRHFFVMDVIGNAPEEWNQPADQGHVYHLFWVPAGQPPQLIGPQNDWLKWLPGDLNHAGLSPII